jgi:hypothetical protein
MRTSSVAAVEGKTSMQRMNGTREADRGAEASRAPSAHRGPPSAVGSALTIIAKVAAGHEQTLERLLTDIGEQIDRNVYIPFARLTRTHFMRWVLLPPASSSEPTQLAFESNYDGSVQELLEQLLEEAPRGLHAIYRHTVGYPAAGEALERSDRGRVIDFLLAQQLPYAAFYVGVPGASVLQIRGEEAMRKTVQAYLAQATEGGLSALELARGALAEVQRDPALAAVLATADDSMPRHPLRLVAGVLAALPLLPAVVPGLLAIRAKELTDEQSPALAIPDSARALMAREDLQVQNQLTHIVPLKTGPLRAVSTRVVLKAIDFLAHTWFTRGQLGGISSIHFARWVLIDEGRRLLFFSNYDGSWESYLGDFIDKAATGLTSVWSNSQKFPDTRFLLFKGATDEERFKAWTRAHQVTTQLWYSAYPELTVLNIINNRKICAGLRRGFRSDRDARQWLQHL